MRTLVCLGCLLVGTLTVAGPLAAQEAETQPAPQLSDAEIVERLTQLSAPGVHHEHLKALVGEWKIAGRFRLAPDMPWNESASEASSEWILGERFVLQHVRGESVPEAPAPFEGYGIFGYDNVTGRYSGMWVDNMGTTMVRTDGTCSENGRTIQFEGTYPNPLTSEPEPFRWVYRFVSQDKYVMESYGRGPDGADFLNMELTHTRKPSPTSAPAP